MENNIAHVSQLEIATDGIRICLEALNAVGDFQIRMAMICTMFDFVCDDSPYDKMDVLDGMCQMIREAYAEEHGEFGEAEEIDFSEYYDEED